ncbi:hypothetical protein A0H81_14846 [Grifola frondosa]|uniref:Uncharacterized protein n=1 Tax=Grifola frondosa TaxID=5627 RepID=A0A1C7LKB0_GRIFR|nr:hypothetical protein A0H81_14846 [Grifola frondosa]
MELEGSQHGPETLWCKDLINESTVLGQLRNIGSSKLWYCNPALRTTMTTITSSDAAAILRQITSMQGQLSALASAMNDLSLDIRNTKQELTAQIAQSERNTVQRINAQIAQTERNLRHDISMQTAYSTSEMTKVVAEAVGNTRSSLEASEREERLPMCFTNFASVSHQD